MVYVLGTITRERTAKIAAALLLALCAGRAVYVLTIEHPERPLFGVHLPETPWEGATAWLEQQPKDTHVLADPGHAWKYGTSVRVAALRDVLLEDVKDSAVAIYSRDVAVRYLERTKEIGDFGSLTPDRVRELADKYDLDYLVTEHDLALPEVYRNEQFRIYSLIPDP